jgi:peptide deformylase
MGIDGQMFEAEGEGLFGRCMQHELDHLTGKLMIDFVGPLKKRQIKKKLESAGHGQEHGHVHGEHCDHDHDHA